MKKNTIAKLIYMVVVCILILPLYGRECDSVIAAYFGCSVGLNSIFVCGLIDHILK